MNKWERLKDYLKKDMEGSKELAKLTQDELERDRWKSCALTAQYAFDYMEQLEEEEEEKE